MGKQTRTTLVLVILVLLVAQAFTQRWLEPFWRKNYAPKGHIVTGLSPEQLLVALGGLREFMAGILWVRADGFFHTGNYDAILPMVRIVTWLDPHQVDVYSTGAWHMAYNFTDEQQRSDRRYIAPALALLKEGTENNPRTYELFFENAWMYHHKVEDHYDRAAALYEQAWLRPDILPARRNMLAHAYEKDAQIDKAIDTWYRILEFDTQDLLKTPNDYTAKTTRDTAEHNLDLLLLRKVARKYDTVPPLDVRFGARVIVEEPKVIRVVGHLGINALGPRVRCVLKDAGYTLPNPASEFSFDVPRGLTYMQESLYVKETRIDRKIDMSRDPSMYSFKADKYDVVFFYNPRLAAPHIQDRLGFSGEGMADRQFLRDGYELSGRQRPSPDAKWNVIYCTVQLTRDQLLRKGEWADKKPVVETAGFVEPPKPKN